MDPQAKSRTQRIGIAAELRHRLAIALEPGRADIARPPLRRLIAEFGYVAEPLRRLTRRDAFPAAVSPRTVVLLPGFATHPVRMRTMARRLEEAGHRVKRWGPGFNWGASDERLATVEARVVDLAQRHGEPVVLVGWSLGGLFAREVAKRRPEAVAKVVTMGSPFSYSPRANNVWRAYHLVAGHRVDEPPVELDLAAKPPVETVALWSARDGIVHPRAARGAPGERDRAVAVRCTHMGFAFDPLAIHAVLRELDNS